MWVLIGDALLIVGSLIALVFTFNRTLDKPTPSSTGTKITQQAKVEESSLSQSQKSLVQGQSSLSQSPSMVPSSSSVAKPQAQAALDPALESVKAKLQQIRDEREKGSDKQASVTLDQKSKAKMKALIAKVNKDSKLSPQAKEKILSRIQEKLARRMDTAKQASASSKLAEFAPQKGYPKSDTRIAESSLKKSASGKAVPVGGMAASDQSSPSVLASSKPSKSVKSGKHSSETLHQSSDSETIAQSDIERRERAKQRASEISKSIANLKASRNANDPERLKSIARAEAILAELDAVLAEGNAPKGKAGNDPLGLSKIDESNYDDVVADLNGSNQGGATGGTSPNIYRQYHEDMTPDELAASEANGSGNVDSLSAQEKAAQAHQPQPGILSRISKAVKSTLGIKDKDSLKITEVKGEEELAANSNGSEALPALENGTEVATLIPSNEPSLSPEHVRGDMPDAVTAGGKKSNKKKRNNHRLIDKQHQDELLVSGQPGLGGASPSLAQPSVGQPIVKPGQPAQAGTLAKAKTVKGVKITNDLDNKRAQEEARRELERRLRNVDDEFAETDPEVGSDEYSSDRTGDMRKTGRNVRMSRADSKLNSRTRNFGRKSELELANDFFEDIDNFIDEIKTEEP